MSDVHEAALKSDKHVVDLQPAQVYDKPSVPGTSWQRCSSAGPAEQNAKMCLTTFLNGDCVFRSERATVSVGKDKAKKQD